MSFKVLAGSLPFVWEEFDPEVESLDADPVEDAKEFDYEAYHSATFAKMIKDLGMVIANPKEDFSKELLPLLKKTQLKPTYRRCVMFFLSSVNSIEAGKVKKLISRDVSVRIAEQAEVFHIHHRYLAAQGTSTTPTFK